ncbi:Shikimate kinase I [hydrothermal vent metagenome]|uniref:Shikimate kinase I n=1 Tax=hydrothermal vent metagenome TaxID=652676 RepID=A0A3B1CQH2_9ZZZZ
MKNVVLLGFMGTGKSIIGRRLAVELRYRFVDTDHLIEKKAQKRIPQIFSEKGEVYFRNLEVAAVAEAAALEAYVIATGGGVPANSLNMDVLSKTGILVTLIARPEVILKRVQRRAGERPLLKGSDPLGHIYKLLKIREEFYKRSDITIDTSDIQIGESVRRIVDQLKKFKRAVL